MSCTISATSNIITLPSYAPVNTVAPVISGNQWQGQVLTTTNGTWTNSPTTFTYQWRRGGVDIGGATSSTYTLVAADRGASITCDVTATNVAGSVTATSNTLAIVDTILDVQNSALAFSTYVLRGAFGTSPLIRLRRTTDNAEVDVFATPQGNITLSSTVTGGGTLGAWIGSNNAVIRTLYDQTGNGRHFDITSPTVQPSFITTGTINTRNSRPTFRFNGSTNYLQQSISAFLSAAQFNVFMVYSTTSAAAPDTALGNPWNLGNANVSTMVLGKGTSTGLLTGEYIFYDVRRTAGGGERLGSSTYRRAANTLVQETDNFLTTGTTLRQNGVAQTLGLTNGGANTTTNYTPANSTITGDFTVFCGIASGSPVNFVNGDLSELIIYTAAVTNTTVENNQRNRFGL